MPDRKIIVPLHTPDGAGIQDAIESLYEQLEDAALEQARIHERRAMLNDLNIRLEFEAPESGFVQLVFGWTVRNACADQSFNDRGTLRIPWQVDGLTLTLELPPLPVEREPDEI